MPFVAIENEFFIGGKRHGVNTQDVSNYATKKLSLTVEGGMLNCK